MIIKCRKHRCNKLASRCLPTLKKMKITVLWGDTPCSLVPSVSEEHAASIFRVKETTLHFLSSVPSVYPFSHGTHSSTLKTEAGGFFKTLVTFYQTMRHRTK
jgi:hypothetical protein